MEAKLDQKLNIVIPIGQRVVQVPDPDPKNKGKTIPQTVARWYVHSTPIPREVFERYFVVISRVFAELYGAGGQQAYAYSMLSAPRVAYLTLRKVATDMRALEEIEGGLVAEIVRLTNVVAQEGTGAWGALPFQDVVDGKILDEDDRAEVMNALVFFTVASCMHRKTEVAAALDGLVSLWDAQTTSSISTAWRPSYATSTATATSPPSAPAPRDQGSSVPS